MTRLASKFPKFFKVKKELDEQNVAIQQKQKQLSAKKKELSERCLPIRKHRGAREKRYSFGYAVFLILALMK